MLSVEVCVAGSCREGTDLEHQEKDCRRLSEARKDWTLLLICT